MHTHPLFMLWTFVLVVIATLHILALEFSLYWLYPWFDIMVHFLGGLFTALFALWLFFESGYVRINNNVQNALLVAGVSILVIGCGKSLSWLQVFLLRIILYLIRLSIS